MQIWWSSIESIRYNWENSINCRDILFSLCRSGNKNSPPSSLSRINNLFHCIQVSDKNKIYTDWIFPFLSYVLYVKTYNSVSVSPLQIDYHVSLLVLVTLNSMCYWSCPVHWLQVQISVCVSNSFSDLKQESFFCFCEFLILLVNSTWIVVLMSTRLWGTPSKFHMWGLRKDDSFGWGEEVGSTLDTILFPEFYPDPSFFLSKSPFIDVPWLYETCKMYLHLYKFISYRWLIITQKKFIIFHVQSLPLSIFFL